MQQEGNKKRLERKQKRLERDKKTRTLFNWLKGDTLSLRGSLLQVCVGEARKVETVSTHDGMSQVVRPSLILLVLNIYN